MLALITFLRFSRLLFRVKHREEFKGMQEFTGALSQGIRKHCATRWAAFAVPMHTTPPQPVFWTACLFQQPSGSREDRQGETLCRGIPRIAPTIALAILAFVMVPMNKFNASFHGVFGNSQVRDTRER